MLLMIDNYDSFTYNLYQYLSELGAEVVTVRNDKATVEEMEELAPRGIVISPGPSTPLEAGVSNDVIRRFGAETPILGVCLGHQCVGQVYGATVGRAGEIRHGKTSMIHHDGEGVLADCPTPSRPSATTPWWSIPETVPDCLKVTAWTDNGLVMGLRHRDYPVEGVQFHPESIMTPMGKPLLQNFLDRLEGGQSDP